MILKNPPPSPLGVRLLFCRAFLFLSRVPLFVARSSSIPRPLQGYLEMQIFRPSWPQWNFWTRSVRRSPLQAIALKRGLHSKERRFISVKCSFTSVKCSLTSVKCSLTSVKCSLTSVKCSLTSLKWSLTSVEWSFFQLGLNSDPHRTSMKPALPSSNCALPSRNAVCLQGIDMEMQPVHKESTWKRKRIV